MKKQSKMVAEFSIDIKMCFGIDQCRTVTIQKGEQRAVDGTIQINNEKGEDICEYLGMELKQMTETRIIEERLQKEFTARLKAICESSLNRRKT